MTPLAFSVTLAIIKTRNGMDRSATRTWLLWFISYETDLVFDQQLRMVPCEVTTSEAFN